jgi:NhaP-type Na+/H+ or K+/H+ antiporter
MVGSAKVGMTEEVLETITIVVLLGIGAQWIAWRLRVPSILLLLLAGFIAGPLTGWWGATERWVDPDALLGELFMPLVALSVGMILFEGGLTLKFNELGAIGKVVRNLISVGALTTWILAGASAHFILGWTPALATLFGAILVVTGPTVILPLLRHVQPTRQIGSTLKWEGILIDPIGALLALLVFEAILARDLANVPQLAVVGFAKTVVIGVGLSWISAGVLVALFKRHWVPDYLQNPVALMGVITMFTLSHWLQPESGLLTVTLMGIVLANQKKVAIRHIIEFKENLRVLLLSVLFILLAAQLKVEDILRLDYKKSAIFLAALFLVVRPVSVWVSTLRSGLSWQERLFLAWMAPRGIVAAAVASIFALRLAEEGHADAETMVPLTFLVIISTVTVYGLTCGPLARRLKLSKPNPQGVLIVGAHLLARRIGAALQKEGYQVLLVDMNRKNLSAARMEGLPTYYGSILSEHVGEEIDLGGIGRLLALTPNREVNSLAVLHFIEFFGRSEVYQLNSDEEGAQDRGIVSPELQGRILFDSGATYSVLMDRLRQGAVIKKTNITDEFDYETFQRHYGGRALPLFLLTEKGDVRIFTAEHPPKPQAGQALMSLVTEQPDQTDGLQARVQNLND